MKILMVTGEYPPMPGGIAGYTELLRRHLAGAGVQMLVMSHAGSGADFRVNDWGWQTARLIRRLTTERAVDAVHIQYQAGAFGMHPAVNLLPRMVSNVPVVTTFHDLRVPYLFPKAGPVRRFVVKRMARWSAAAVVTNPVDAGILKASSIRSHVIHLGPSLPVPDSQDEPGNRVGFFGFPSVQKGFDILLHAVARVPIHDRPRVLIVGSEPPETGAHGYFSMQDVNHLAGRFDVDIEWTGYLDPQKASNALARCKVIAFPFPAGATLRSSALIAALQTRRPVITTRPPDGVRLGGLVHLPQLLLVERNDVEGISRMIQSPPGSPTGERSLPPAFLWPEIARQHQDLYARITGRQEI